MGQDIYLASVQVELKKCGSKYICKCPMHEEKTPSFTVDLKTMTYKCFGCGAEGKVIKE